jgi:hypothetical protein
MLLLMLILLVGLVALFTRASSHETHHHPLI